MARKKKPMYEDGSLAHLADLAFSKITNYADSNDPRDKLLGFNILIFILVIGLAISSWLYKKPIGFSIDYLFLLVISIILAAGVGFGYSFLLETVSKFSKGLKPLSYAITLEFISLSVILAGLLFSQSYLIKIGVGLIGLQLLFVLFGGFISITNVDTEIITNRDIWGLLGKTATLITIGTFIVDIVMLMFKFI
jgi:hypothetical protein